MATTKKKTAPAPTAAQIAVRENFAAMSRANAAARAAGVAPPKKKAAKKKAAKKTTAAAKPAPVRAAASASTRPAKRAPAKPARAMVLRSGALCANCNRASTGPLPVKIIGGKGPDHLIKLELCSRPRCNHPRTLKTLATRFERAQAIGG